MLFKDLEHRWKLSISGSINSKLRSISSDVVYEEIFDSWYKDKFQEVESNLQYVKITDERLDIDDELLVDIKKVFQERFHKKVERVKVKDVERTKKQKEDKATDKQLNYARKLYKKVYGEEKGFDDRVYSKFEMVEIIGELVDKSNKVNIVDCTSNDFKVIEFRKK